MARTEIKACKWPGFRIFAFAAEILNWFVECFHYAPPESESGGHFFWFLVSGFWVKWARIYGSGTRKMDYWPLKVTGRSICRQRAAGVSATPAIRHSPRGTRNSVAAFLFVRNWKCNLPIALNGQQLSSRTVAI